MQDDDFSLFKSEMRGVKRISVDRADTGKPRNDRQQLKQRQLNASVRNDETSLPAGPWLAARRRVAHGLPTAPGNPGTRPEGSGPSPDDTRGSRDEVVR